MNLKVICDERTKEDMNFGKEARKGWNERALLSNKQSFTIPTFSYKVYNLRQFNINII